MRYDEQEAFFMSRNDEDATPCKGFNHHQAAPPLQNQSRDSGETTRELKKQNIIPKKRKKITPTTTSEATEAPKGLKALTRLVREVLLNQQKANSNRKTSYQEVADTLIASLTVTEKRDDINNDPEAPIIKKQAQLSVKQEEETLLMRVTPPTIQNNSSVD
jgi:hypothetical protein